MKSHPVLLMNILVIYAACIIYYLQIVALPGTGNAGTLISGQVDTSCKIHIYRLDGIGLRSLKENQLSYRLLINNM